MSSSSPSQPSRPLPPPALAGSPAKAQKPTVAAHRPLRVLVVDRDAETRERLIGYLAGPGLRVRHAGSLATARCALTAAPADVLLIEPELPDGSGLAFAADLLRSRPATQVIALGAPSAEATIDAVRAGVGDALTKPVDLREARDRVAAAAARRRAMRDRGRRVDRLRRACRKLAASRDEVAQRVDVLCTDLVSAYQELATQVQQVAQAGEFAAVVRGELDLEALLRRTLEYLLGKAGPTNAAVFLPSCADEYTLGGYVNYDCTAESADALLGHLADVLAPRVACREGVLHVTDDAALGEWIGDDAAYLADSHVVAFACRRDAETLAVVALFRDADDPFPAEVVEACGAIAPLLAAQLARIIRIHHRHHREDAEGAA